MSSNSSKGDPKSGSSGGGCPVKHGGSEQPPPRPSSESGCPVKHNNNDLPYKTSLPFGLPASIEESANHSQSPLADQKIPLSTRRVVSSIPRASSSDDDDDQSTPHHQPPNTSQWIYPSEQQFYTAMRKKGWQGVDEATIPAVVRIHNTVNELGWSQVQEWERTLHSCDNPSLVSFLGRPNDLSPRAWASTYLLGNRPFDRHDWFVDRNDGTPPQRYVIDFYSNASSNGVYLDVRPALDSPQAAADRMKMFCRDAFPAIFSLFAASQQQQQSKPNGGGDNTKKPPS